MIHQRLADTPPLVARIDEQAADLVADQRQETNQAPVGLVDKRLGLGHPNVGNLATLLGQELLGEKRVRLQRCPVPDIEQLRQVILGKGSNLPAMTIRPPG